MSNDIRELTIDELDIVSGGGDPNYHFCFDGPAGTGTYPNSVPCNPPPPPPPPPNGGVSGGSPGGIYGLMGGGLGGHPA
jgi:hypothetical protein